MQAFPHRYAVTATAHGRVDVTVTSDRLAPIDSAPPAEFDGPGDQWSPETLFVAAVGDCYVLTFCTVAALHKLPWTSIVCHADGVVDRPERTTQFVAFDLQAQLVVPAGCDQQFATRLLEQAKHACLITNSLKAPVRLEATVAVDLQGAA
jgi:organic hydroperoxide reductase OsmC/OhrA